MRMSSTYAIYPGGPLGSGLAILRVAAAALLLHCWLPEFAGLGALAIAVVAAFVATGLWMRWTAVFCAFGLALTASAPLDTVTVMTASCLIALALTGPGAFSIDARRSGRIHLRLPTR